MASRWSLRGGPSRAREIQESGGVLGEKSPSGRHGAGVTPYRRWRRCRASVTPSTRPLHGVEMAWMQKKLTRKKNTGARLVRADHAPHPEERPQGDPHESAIRSNLLRPPGHHRLLRGRVRAGRGPVHFTGEDQGRPPTSPNSGSGLLALRRPDQLRLHPDRVHPALRELRVVRLDDLSFIEVAGDEEVGHPKFIVKCVASMALGRGRLYLGYATAAVAGRGHIGGAST